MKCFLLLVGGWFFWVCAYFFLCDANFFHIQKLCIDQLSSAEIKVKPSKMIQKAQYYLKYYHIITGNEPKTPDSYIINPKKFLKGAEGRLVKDKRNVFS